jgi:hypothetical protein
VYHGHFFQRTKGLAHARTVASRSVLRARCIPRGNGVERRERIPGAIVETSVRRSEACAGKCGSEKEGREK